MQQWMNDFQKQSSDEVQKMRDALFELQAHLNNGGNTVDGKLFFETVELIKQGVKNLEEIAEANS